jgi:hypothetical protein
VSGCRPTDYGEDGVDELTSELQSAIGEIFRVDMFGAAMREGKRCGEPWPEEILRRCAAPLLEMSPGVYASAGHCANREHSPA